MLQSKRQINHLNLSLNCRKLESEFEFKNGELKSVQSTPFKPVMPLFLGASIHFEQFVNHFKDAS
jgi:hypothetical protein